MRGGMPGVWSDDGFFAWQEGGEESRGRVSLGSADEMASAASEVLELGVKFMPQLVQLQRAWDELFM